MEQDTFIPEQQPEKKRPQLLSVLCILTFISTGISLIGVLSILLFPDIMIRVVNASTEFDAQAKDDLILILEAGTGYYTVVLLLTFASLLGAVLMWKLKKSGFHFYAISNIVLFYLPIIWLGYPFNIVAAIFPAIFIGLYAMHLKFMK